MRRPDLPVEQVAEIAWGALLVIYLAGAWRASWPAPLVVAVFGASALAALVELWLRRIRWRHLNLYDMTVWTVLLGSMVAVTGGRASEVWPAYLLMSLTAPSLGRPVLHFGLIGANALVYAGLCLAVNPEGVPLVPSLLVLRVGLFFLVAYIVDRSMGRERAALLQAIAAGRNRAAELVGARDAERRRIAADLHDWLGTGIVGPMRKLELALRAPDEAGLRAKAAEAVEAMRRSHDDVRRIMEALHPHLLEQLGLAGALEAHLQQWALAHGLVATFSQEGAAGLEPPADVALAAYRILQEALNNVARHAGASQVDVTLRVAGGEVRLTVRDDGRGFTAPAPAGGGAGTAAGVGGRGLVGMAERVAIFAGTVAVTSAPGRGTTVTAVLPLPVRTG